MKKHSYEYVKNYFKNQGHVLLSTEYIRGCDKLEYICPEGHKNSMSFENFKRGKRCPICSKKKSVKNMTETKRKQAEENYYKNPKYCVCCGDMLPYRRCDESYKTYCEKKECQKASRSMNKDIFVRKYGEVEGIKRFIEYQRKRVKSRTLEGYIERFGEELGIKKYTEIKNKMIGCGYSKISQKLFWGIYNKLPVELQKQCYFAELNKEFGRWSTENNRGYFFDFTVLGINIIIEFNGDDIHANPLTYKENDFTKYIKPKKAKDIWEYDNKKKKYIENEGFECIYVWESDFRDCPQIIVEELSDKLLEKYNEI